MQEPKRGRGRPPTPTPEQLLLAVARVMLDRRGSAWRAASIVTDSPAGKAFAKARTLTADSMQNRLHRGFLANRQALLAKAGRQIEFERRRAKDGAEIAAALARGEVPAWLAGGADGLWAAMTAASRFSPEARAEHGMAMRLWSAVSDWTPLERAVDEASDARRRAEHSALLAQEARRQMEQAARLGPGAAAFTLMEREENRRNETLMRLVNRSGLFT